MKNPLEFLFDKKIFRDLAALNLKFNDNHLLRNITNIVVVKLYMCEIRNSNICIVMNHSEIPESAFQVEC